MGLDEAVFTGPAVTALGLAGARSVETGRPDRLIDDPWARHLLAAAGAELPMRLDWPEPGDSVTETEALHLHGSRYIGLRTRFYDDLLSQAARAGCSQGVLLGAGLDTRAYRLSLPPGFRLFEIDQPELLTWKRTALGGLSARAGCTVVDVGTDLRQAWPIALLAGGFDPAQQSAFVAEGLLAYLTPTEQLELLARIDTLVAGGGMLALDRIAGDPHSADRLAALSRRSGMNMTDLIAAREDAGTAELLIRCGWRVREEAVTTVANRYGRDLGDPFSEMGAAQPSGEPPWLETTFLSADREA